MNRAYDRLKKIATNNGDEISNTDASDAAEDFFTKCYHLKDWLKKEFPHLSSDIENHITSSQNLSLAADYCNTFKHGGLDKQSRHRDEIEKINTHINIDFSSTGFLATSSLEITIGGVKHDALQLASDCIKEWDEYLAKHEISFN